VEAWQRFSAELQFEAVSLPDFMAGYDTVEQTREHVQGLA
jgi:hypothetical protein